MDTGAGGSSSADSGIERQRATVKAMVDALRAGSLDSRQDPAISVWEVRMARAIVMLLSALEAKDIVAREDHLAVVASIIDRMARDEEAFTAMRRKGSK